MPIMLILTILPPLLLQVIASLLYKPHITNPPQHQEGNKASADLGGRKH